MNTTLSEIWAFESTDDDPGHSTANLNVSGESYELILLMLLKGSGHFLSPDGERLAGTGDLFIWQGCSTVGQTPPPLSAGSSEGPLNHYGICGSSEGIFGHYGIRGSGTYTAAVFHLPIAKLADMGNLSVIQMDSAVFKENRGELRQLKNLLTASLLKALEPGALSGEADPSLWQIMTWLLQHCIYEDIHTPQSHEERLDFIRRYVHSGCIHRLSLDQLAQKMELSAPYLSKFIKEHLGQNFHSYVDTVRLSYTMREARINPGAFSFSALRCGFPNMTAFGRAFENVYHQSPSIYKRQAASAITAASPDPRLCRHIRAMAEGLGEGKNPPAAPYTIHIQADAGTGRPYTNNWMNVLNLGYAEDLQKGSISEHILLLKKELGFSYGRVENIFSQGLFVDIHSSGRFNFLRVDLILDFLIKNQIIPFLNMSFNDKIIRKDINSLFMKETIVKTFDNDDQYRRLIEAFFAHCVARYGTAEVKKWRIELQWIHSPGDGMKEKWLDVFDILYRAVKKYSPGTLVGGFCFNTNCDIQILESYLKKKKTVRPDFISVVCYPYHVPGPLCPETSSLLERDMDYIGKKLDELLLIFKEHGYDSSRLYVTEWNISVSNSNYLHDSCWKAAYILRTAGEGIDKAWCMAHWGCTDRTTEYFDSIRLLNGRNGLISRNGICKPAFFAYRFLEHMGPRLIQKGKHYILTKNRADTYFLVCHHLAAIRDSYYQQEDECVDFHQIAGLFDSEILELCLKLSGIHADSYRVEKLSVSPEAGSVLDEWLRLGYPDENSDMERSWLSRVCVPRYSLKLVQASDGCLCVNTQLSANEIQFLKISPCEM